MAKSLFDLRDRVRSEPAWVIPGFLKRQNTAIVMGQPKRTCKSWLVLGMCWDMSEGKSVWGMKREGGDALFPIVKPLRSVYFTQEDTEDDIHDRALAHFGAHREPNDRLWVVEKNLGVVLDSFQGRALVQKELDEVVAKAGAIDLVVFDPMRRMHHGDENDSATIAQLWGIVDRIHKRYNCATLFIHHTVKPPRDGSGWDQADPFTGRGSGDIYGGGDAFMVVVSGRGTSETRVVTVNFESKRGKPLPPAKLKVEYATGGVRFMGAAWPREDLEPEFD